MAVNTPGIAIGVRGTRVAGLIAPPQVSSSLYVLLPDADG